MNTQEARAYIAAELKERHTPISLFYHLVLEANLASEKVDAFDVRSDQPDSAAKFNELIWLSRDASIVLIEHVRMHADAIRVDLP